MNFLRSVRPGAWMILTVFAALLLLETARQGVARGQSRVRRLHAQERSLHSRAESLRREQEAVGRMLDRERVSMDLLVETYAGDLRIGVASHESDTLGGTWRLHRAEVEFRALSWERLRAFIVNVEAQTPPWALRSMDLRSEPDGLEGRMLFESMDRTETQRN
jgi:hypothetical protein